MSMPELLLQFELLNRARRSRAEAMERLRSAGELAKRALTLVMNESTSVNIRWGGRGPKRYQVRLAQGGDSRWSRALNIDLFIAEPDSFSEMWSKLADTIEDARGSGCLQQEARPAVDGLFYTALMSWAVCVDLWSPSRGLPGTFLEMLIGPTISALSGVPETGAVRIALPDGLGEESVKVDLTFHRTRPRVSLEVPTKISTRERISQAYVHHAILNKVAPGQYRAVLIACSENNAFFERGRARTVNSLVLKDTLVPATVSLYQKYISQLDGIFYLDPPEEYLERSSQNGFPRVQRLGDLLTDLPAYFSKPGTGGSVRL